ncbi:CBS domain-containing protein [Streptomyces sp. SLBN-31]|uniref:CBS domain-containing protein n=1 Tax=Streptomyces sp. SLBN-31 TaxID=2768444 RepID=UPI00116C2D10|nr:CBS domain-containing protein [Streptomyces sp. SLBN-31]TQJ92742.1 CBS domain protein [Streptomyces sp. SLBN-31]
MTLLQMQSRTAGANTLHRTAVDVMDAAGPQVCDDMSVEVALAVMAAARTGRLVVCDQDDQPVGLVTRTDLTTVRDSGARTDRVRLRDLRCFHGSFTPLTTVAKPGSRCVLVASVFQS